MREETVKRRMPAHVLIERSLRVMTVLAVVCLIIGFPLYIISRATGNSDSVAARLGAYVLLIGVALSAMRIFFWITEEVVGRGLAMVTQGTKQNTFSNTWLELVLRLEATRNIYNS